MPVIVSTKPGQFPEIGPHPRDGKILGFVSVMGDTIAGKIEY